MHLKVSTLVLIEYTFDVLFRLELVSPEVMANGEELANGSIHAEVLNVSELDLLELIAHTIFFF
jgi:hypothetical protein